MANNKYNKGIIIIISIIIIVIGWYSTYWIRYYYAMVKSNEDDSFRQCKEQTDESFHGKIRNVNRFEYDEYMKNHFIALDIVPDSGISFTYQFYYEDAKNKLNFIETGDSITKDKSDLFLVIKTNGNKKKFKVPGCQ